MKSIGTILGYFVLFGIGYTYLRSYWCANEGLNGELFD